MQYARKDVCTFKETLNSKSHLHVSLLIKVIMFETRSISFYDPITAHKNDALYSTKNNTNVQVQQNNKINSTIINIKPSYIVFQC